ncbi:RNA polymerase sigma-70 factor [Flavivirga amylovorans]|uniref:RNA polymerase sigma-70 factor n=1 Tax=Flavivirga amylovorans TaxID=870486 RepID=A0ABT8X853_9FLAO|nr:RNA polymerase sigma-70 factor [Flavivirga amylovorans]MDO5989740.1 RNA polymerase sigma-70 factor [Flavivirga amylovorans]
MNFYVSQLEKGEIVAFEALFKLYYDKLVHVAGGYLVRTADAENIVQNIFLKLWEDRAILKHVSNMNSYLYRMTKNACLDQLKHEKIKTEYLVNSYQKKNAIQKQFLKDGAASLLLEKELEQIIQKAIEQLPEKCKRVFVKSRFEGLKHHEIAHELGISKRTVDNHISNALKYLRLHLKEFITIFLYFFIF